MHPLATLEAPSSRPTQSQVDFVSQLLAQAFPTAKPAEIEKLTAMLGRAARHEVSTMIDVIRRQKAEVKRAERLEAMAAPVDTAAPMRDLFGPTPVATEFKAGLYHGMKWSDGKVVFIYMAKAGTHWLAKEVVGYGTNEVRFNYLGGALANTDYDQRLTVEEHLAFGQLAGACGYCGLKLDDPHSRSLGYGPRCAKVHGLPY